MNARHWIDCTPSLTHGNVVQRVLFRKRAAEPGDAAGVLSHAEWFARACLEPRAVSTPQANRGVQRVFFVAAGSATLVAGGDERRVGEGDGILVPPGVEHAFRNDADDPLELLIVEERIPSGVALGRPAVKIRNYRDAAVHQAHWHHLVRRVFGPEDGLARLHTVLVVRMEPMTTSEPHPHPADVDEVWYMWKGSGVHVVGREMCIQTPGTAVQVAPSDPGHCLINHTEEPLQAFYFACLPR